MTRPRIYVASLSDYNAGRLHGRWIDVDQDLENILAEVTAMLAESREPIAEEWAIHDYEGFGSWSPSEWEPLETVATVAQGIAEHGPAYAAYVKWGYDPEDFEECYQGDWESEREFAMEFAEGTGLLRESDLWPYTCIDWERATRELFYDYWSAPSEGGRVYVFSSY